MADLVSREPMGPGEHILLQDAEDTFRGWTRVAVTITPSVTWGALGHLEAGRFSRPGDAPVLWAMSNSSIPPGSPTANGIYRRTGQAASANGAGWDADYTDVIEAARKGMLGQALGEGAPNPSRSYRSRDGSEVLLPDGVSPAPYLEAMGAPSPDDGTTLGGLLKGTSRWLMLALDAVPEGIDAIGRGAQAIKSGQLDFGEVVGGLLGINRDAAQQVGIPLTQYIAAGLRGERLNMGTGFFATGEIPEEIAAQLALFDEETSGLTTTDFNRLRELGGGKVLVPGLNGQSYEARNLEELVFLRTQVGRAALLENLEEAGNPQLQTMGVPYGAFNEGVYDEGTVARRNGTGTYYAHSTGRTIAASMFEPESIPFQVMSTYTDLGKQLLDLNVVGLAGRGVNLVSRAARFVGLGDEAAQLAEGTSILNRLVEGADLPAVDGAVRDAMRGTLNRDLAAQAIARPADENLRLATSTVGALRTNGLRVAEREGKALSPNQIDSLVSRASRGDWAARKWGERILSDTGDPNVNVALALDNLAHVTGREGVDLVAGRFGRPEVADDVWDAAYKETDTLSRLFSEGKASVVRDPDTGKGLLTFDADLGRAQATLDTLISGPTPPATQQRLVKLLIGENYTARRWAERALGDTDEAAAQVDNLTRVLKRSDGDRLLIDEATSMRPRIEPSRLSSILSGDGRAADLVTSLREASTMREVQAILSPTVEFSGKIPPTLVSALARATTDAEIVDVFLRLASGQHIVSPHIALLGNAARFGSLSTFAGTTAGAAAGAAEQAGLPDTSIVDIIGGGLAGAVVGALAGSGVGSTLGYMFGKSTRQIGDLADAMDLMLAGTRSATADLIRASGTDMGRAQAGLGIPQQMSYAWGHSALGRRIARNAGAQMNINDPTDVFYRMSDYTRTIGVEMDDVVTVMVKGTGESREVVRLVRSSFDGDAEKVADEVARLTSEGYRLDRVARMDDAFHAFANATPNNPAAFWRAFRSWAEITDAFLSDAGSAYRSLLTNFAARSTDEFMGSTGAMAQSVAHAQLAVAGRIKGIQGGARLEAELWNGMLNLPAPELVHRAATQLDTMGRVTQLFTGAGVSSQLRANLSRLARGEDWMKITPELERNVAMRTARALTTGLWAPAVLLLRPFAFLSRVLGEDQARMAASGLDNMFTHPISYLSAILGNWTAFQRMGRVRGVAARSIIPDEIVDPARQADLLDNMSHWDMAEEARHALAIYDRTQAAHRRMFGQTSWARIARGKQNYLEAVTTEYRQLIQDPMVRHMARASSDDPVEETLSWLFGTSQGQKVAHDWARQFTGYDNAAEYMSPQFITAFLQDQYARMHLKTGGDWIWKQGNTLLDSGGNVIDDALASSKGWDQLDDGYTIIRKGDEELLEVVGSGSMRNVRLIDEEGVEYMAEVLRVKDHLTEQKWDAIKGLVRDKHERWMADTKLKDYDPFANRVFPAYVKGTVTDGLVRERKGIIGIYDDALDSFYDWVLGRPSRIFSRQPVFGNHYWERIGMLYPSMTPELQSTFEAIARKEGAWSNVRQIAGAVDQAGARAPGTLTDLRTIETNAKAYAVERTRDILFDLHRQRNFIDGMRLVLPFAGPFVEAMEAWTRVISQNPLYVWRRGGQLINHLWDQTGLESTETTEGRAFNQFASALDPGAGERGWFWNHPDTGEEMFTYPFLGSFLPNWLDAGGPGGSDRPPLEARARGLNIMFGSEDLTAGATPEFSGLPLGAFQPGIGPTLQVAVAPLMKSRDGVLANAFEVLFPFGSPDNVYSLLPYNVRKLLEGQLGESSRQELVRNTMVQFQAMVAAGEVGPGPGFDHDISAPGGANAALAEANQRAIHHNMFEGLMRSILPTVMTPEVMVEFPNQVPEFNPEGLITIESLASFARELVSEEGAQIWETPDGYRVSTEGDFEVATEYMNQLFGVDMFSAEFLSLPVTNRRYTRSYTASGRDWTRQREKVIDTLRNTASFLMPDYANIESDEPFDFEAQAEGLARGDLTYFTLDEQRIQIESRLLKMGNRQIEREALEVFGPTEDMEVEQREVRDAWVSRRKEQLAGRFDAGTLPESQEVKVRTELTSWDTIDWASLDLDPAELETVEAVLWYLDVRSQALNILNGYGISALDNKGEGEDEQMIATSVRQDLIEIVERQLSSTEPAGNFPYLWERYFKGEVTGGEDDWDPLSALAQLRAEDDDFAPYAASLGIGVDG